MKLINEIAKEYVESFGEVFPGVIYGFENFKEFTFKYYYDFIFIIIDKTKPNSLPAGGSVGFTIDKETKTTASLSFGELGELECKEKELENVYTNLVEFRDSAKSLSWLKNEYNLNSRQLLNLKKVVENTTIDKKYIFKQLNELIDSVKS